MLFLRFSFQIVVFHFTDCDGDACGRLRRLFCLSVSFRIAARVARASAQLLSALVNQNAMMQCAKRSIARKAWELMGEDLPATDGQTLEVRKPQNRRTERFYMRFRSSGITQKLKLEHDEDTVTLHRIEVIGVVLSGAKNFPYFRSFPLPDEAGYVVEIEQSTPCKTTNTHYCNTLCVDWG